MAELGMTVERSVSNPQSVWESELSGLPVNPAVFPDLARLSWARVSDGRVQTQQLLEGQETDLTS
ncbi:MAG: hypothetical protein OXB95_09110 [Rhodobacteraceae bacterium]|nr:hypothetical protein [Paracoccaceae bacterium]